LACLTITHDGSSNAVTQRHAASASATLLNESSLPCSCRYEAIADGGAAGSRVPG